MLPKYSSNLSLFSLQPRIPKVLSQSLEQLFLTVGQNNFGNKILFPSSSEQKNCNEWAMRTWGIHYTAITLVLSISLMLTIQCMMQRNFTRQLHSFFNLNQNLIAILCWCTCFLQVVSLKLFCHFCKSKQKQFHIRGL